MMLKGYTCNQICPFAILLTFFGHPFAIWRAHTFAIRSGFSTHIVHQYISNFIRLFRTEISLIAFRSSEHLLCCIQSNSHLKSCKMRDKNAEENWSIASNIIITRIFDAYEKISRVTNSALSSFWWRNISKRQFLGILIIL